MTYPEELAQTLRAIHDAEVVTLDSPASTSALIAALSSRPSGDVYVEIDRTVIGDVEASGDGTDLLPYMYPVAVRYDTESADVFIHVTDADRATDA